MTVEKLVYGGEGLAHHEGATVFVPFVLPSERVKARTLEEKKKFVRAGLERVLDASTARVTAACPHFGVCGGCDYQHMGYDAQVRYKTEILRETLRRIGKVEWDGEIASHASEPWRYRNRAQWKVREMGRGGAKDEMVREETPAASRDGSPAIGYFRAHSAALCAVHDCPILSPVLLKTLLAVREALSAGELPRELREIETFGSEADGADTAGVLLTFTFAGFPSRAAEHAARVREIVPEAESVLFRDPSGERMELFGPGFVEYSVGETKYRVGHFSFFQVNRFLVEELARTVAGAAFGGAEQRGELALDLFAGVGLFAVALAETSARVVAVESNPAATRDLEANCRGRQNVEIRTADVEQFLQKYRGAPELVVIDPPRAGLTPEIIRRLVAIAPRQITYVSCEPPTLARDLRGLVDGGYEISEMHLFDLFPQTFHMETVVQLRRR